MSQLTSKMMLLYEDGALESQVDIYTSKFNHVNGVTDLHIRVCQVDSDVKSNVFHRVIPNAFWRNYNL